MQPVANPCITDGANSDTKPVARIDFRSGITFEGARRKYEGARSTLAPGQLRPWRHDKRLK